MQAAFAPCSLLPSTLPAHPEAANNGDAPAQQQAQPPQQPQPPVVMLADGRLQQPAPLGAVVSDALRRWYLETEKEALRGDVVSRTKLIVSLGTIVRHAVPGRAFSDALLYQPVPASTFGGPAPSHTHTPCLAARPAEGTGAAGPDAD